MANARGLDLSHHQAEPLSFHAMRDGGMSFVFLKATQGAGYTDPTFGDRRERARSVGMRVGGYHFFDPAADPDAQARHFLAVLGSLRAGDLPPVLDLEEADGWQAQTPDVRTSRVLRFVTVLEESLATAPVGLRKPMVYTRPNFVGMMGLRGLADLPLWLARYPSKTPKLLKPEPGTVKPWPNWTCWQYTEKGQCPGVPGPVDLNVWNGPLP